MPALYVFSRSTADSGSPNHKPVYIAGFVVAAVTILAVAAWIGLKRYRKHIANKREEKLGAAFLSVRGLVKDPDSAPWIEKETIVGYVYSQINCGAPFNIFTESANQIQLIFTVEMAAKQKYSSPVRQSHAHPRFLNITAKLINLYPSPQLPLRLHPIPPPKPPSSAAPTWKLQTPMAAFLLYPANLLKPRLPAELRAKSARCLPPSFRMSCSLAILVNSLL